MSSNLWIPFQSVVEVVTKAIAGAQGTAREWCWTRNTRCKYIELRIDMRDGRCLIRDRNSAPITLQQLQQQQMLPSEGVINGQGPLPSTRERLRSAGITNALVIREVFRLPTEMTLEFDKELQIRAPEWMRDHSIARGDYLVFNEDGSFEHVDAINFEQYVNLRIAARNGH